MFSDAFDAIIFARPFFRFQHDFFAAALSFTDIASFQPPLIFSRRRFSPRYYRC